MILEDGGGSWCDERRGLVEGPATGESSATAEGGGGIDFACVMHVSNVICNVASETYISY